MLPFHYNPTSGDTDMTDEDLEVTITQLQQQVELMTQALIAMLEGKWVGAPPSAEAYLYALNPWLQGKLKLDPPVVP
jgi:hypothetical protein